MEGVRRAPDALFPQMPGARRTFPDCPPPSDGARRSPRLRDPLDEGALRLLPEDEPLSDGARRVRLTLLEEMPGERRRPLDPLVPTRLLLPRDRELEMDGELLRRREEEVNPRLLDGREPRLTLGARRLDPPDLDAEPREDPPLTRRFWAITGSAAIARISAKAAQKTLVRFWTRAFTSHLQTGQAAQGEQVFLSPR